MISTAAADMLHTKSSSHHTVQELRSMRKCIIIDISLVYHDHEY